MGRPCLCVQRASGQVNGALVSSQEHSVSPFFSVRSLTRPVNLSLSVNFSFLSQLMLFLTISIYFYPISSCHPSYFPLATQGFLSRFSLPPSHRLFQPFCLAPLLASVCCVFYLLSMSPLQNRPLSNIIRQIRRPCWSVSPSVCRISCCVRPPLLPLSHSPFFLWRCRLWTGLHVCVLPCPAPA